MLDLLNGTANSIDVDDLDINEQKEKADEIINELQEKIREITLEELQEQEREKEKEKEKEEVEMETQNVCNNSDVKLKILQKEAIEPKTAFQPHLKREDTLCCMLYIFHNIKGMKGIYSEFVPL